MARLKKPDQALLLATTTVLVFLATAIEAPADLQITAPPPAPDTTGEKKVIVILANFQDKPAQPISPGEAYDVVFNPTTGVSAYYYEASYHQTRLSGRVAGDKWYTLPFNVNPCPEEFARIGYARIYDEAVRAADNDVDFRNYGHMVVLIPEVAGCLTGGAAAVLPVPHQTQEGSVALREVWLASTGNPDQVPFVRRAIAHELGHTFGLGHTNRFDCGPATIQSTGCASYEYGGFDVMGTDFGHFNAGHKDRLGWFSRADSQTLQTGENRTYTLVPLEDFGAGLRALRLPMTFHVLDNQHGWYYLEYRQPRGFDQTIRSPGHNAFNGTLVHFRTHDSPVVHLDTVHLLDMTPQSSSNQFADFWDAALPIGQTFTDPSGLRITAVSADSNGLTVQVSAPYPLEVTELSVPSTSSTPLTDIFYQDAAGNVGIGTTEPGTIAWYANPALAIAGSRPALALKTTGVGGLATIQWVGPSPGSQFHLNFADGVNSALGLYSYQANAEIIRFQGNGNIGIGTSTPTAKLHVEAGDGQHFRFTQAGLTAWDGGAYSDNTFRINQSGVAARFVINSSGNVGIGTADPQGYKLYVNGPAWSTGGWGGSSIALKTHLQRLSPTEEQALLAKVRDLTLYRYRLKQPDGLKATHLGLIAEEAPEELVDQQRTAMSYGDSLAVLLGAAKAQLRQLERLEHETNALIETQGLNQQTRQGEE